MLIFTRYVQWNFDIANVDFCCLQKNPYNIIIHFMQLQSPNLSFLFYCTFDQQHGKKNSETPTVHKALSLSPDHLVVPSLAQPLVDVVQLVPGDQLGGRDDALRGAEVGALLHNQTKILGVFFLFLFYETACPQRALIFFYSSLAV